MSTIGSELPGGRPSNFTFYVRMGATLLLLLFAVVASALATGIVLTFLFIVAYVFTSYEFLPVPLLLLVLGSSTVGVLGTVAWGERDAPNHAISALGDASIDEADHPELSSIVRSVAQQAVVPVPDIYVSPIDTPISLTTGFRPKSARLVVSEGLLEALTDAELEAVVAHEIAHVRNRDTSVMTVATLPIAAADRVLTLLTGKSYGVEYGQPSRADYADALVAAGLLFSFPIWLCGYALWASLSRMREFAADRGAVAMTGDPGALMTALERLDETVTNQPTTDLRQVEVAAFTIVETDRSATVGGLSPLPRPLRNVFATHPPTSARIERLRAVARELEANPDSGAESR